MRSAIRYPPSVLAPAWAVHAASRRGRAVICARCRFGRGLPRFGRDAIRYPLSAFRAVACVGGPCRFAERPGGPLRALPLRSGSGLPSAIRYPLSAFRAVACVGGPCRFAERPGGPLRALPLRSGCGPLSAMRRPWRSLRGAEADRRGRARARARGRGRSARRRAVPRSPARAAAPLGESLASVGPRSCPPSVLSPAWAVRAALRRGWRPALRRRGWRRWRP